MTTSFHYHQAVIQKLHYWIVVTINLLGKPSIEIEDITGFVTDLDGPETFASFKKFPNLREIIMYQQEGLTGCVDVHNAVLCPTVVWLYDYWNAIN